MASLPTFITFTGLDAWTDLERVEDLSRRYPIEWGVLFSPKRQGVEPRYPAHSIVLAINGRSIRRAAHLCGGYARTVLEIGRCPELQHLLAGNFARYQINTDDASAGLDNVQRFAARMDWHCPANLQSQEPTAILQCRDPLAFPYEHQFDWLYDRSGGRGDLPQRWPVPSPRGPLVGYAGGLGPDTVADALKAIQRNQPVDRPYWIDMETGIRTDDRLDLDKCEAVCRAVYGSTTSEAAA